MRISDWSSDVCSSDLVDGICVGEPWNSIAVERGVGRIALETAQIWRRGVEKVLAMRSEIADERRDAVEALVRALHHAAAHFVEPANARSEEPKSELQPLLRTSYAGFCLKKKKQQL